ncbi:MAG: DUF3857 domain-containing protein [Candidatus Zixiibacteriota bacterium]|nr:MAG: DUF3857 domain-containing protein [candidate division Zixibacteria bacterium]
MKYLLITFLAFFGISEAGERKSAFHSREIVIEFNGKKKIKNYSDKIAIQDDIAEDEFRHFCIFFPYQGKVKDVELSLIRGGSVIREQNLKDAEKYIHRAEYILASDAYYYYWDLGALDPGDIIKRRYRIELKDASYGDYEPILSFIPVKKAIVTIKYPVDDWALSYCIDNGDLSLEENERELGFIWEDLPGLKDSDFEKAPRDVWPGIWYLFESKKEKRDFSDWSGVYEWHQDLCEGTSLTEKDLDLLDIANTPEEIFSKIIKECRYVGVEIKEGRVKPMPAAKVWAQGYGDCKALANLYVSWLKLAGYEAWPVLVRSRNSCLGNPDFPSPSQFDHEIAAFISEEGDTVYQDLTAESIPFGDIPISHYGDFALPLKANTVPIRLPFSPRHPDTIRYSIRGVIDESFDLSGQVVYRLSGQRARRDIWKARNVQKGVDRKLIVKSDFESAMKGAVFDNIEEHFQGDTVIIRTGDIRKRNIGFLLDTLVILKPWIMDYLTYDIETDTNRTWPTILRRNVIYIAEYRCELNGVLLGKSTDSAIPSISGDFEFNLIDKSFDDSLIISAIFYLPPRILEPDDYLSYASERLLVSEALSKGLYYEKKN